MRISVTASSSYVFSLILILNLKNVAVAFNIKGGFFSGTGKSPKRPQEKKNKMSRFFLSFFFFDLQKDFFFFYIESMGASAVLYV